MNNKAKELIKAYEAIIFGNDEDLGLIHLYNYDYKSSWDERIENAKQLKKELGIED